MTGQKVARQIGNLLSPAGRRGRLAVFCYHQVLESPDEFRCGEPTAAEFADDVEIISNVFNTLTFDESVTRLREGTLPARAACITFDDGYANNHSLAAPILERAGVPATFFVAGGAIDDGIMWNDLVIEASAGAGGSPAVPAEIGFLTLPDSADNKSEVVAALLSQIKYRPLNERWDIAARLYSENCREETPRMMMSREMVKDLAARGFEVGGHTINHPILKELSDNAAREEIHSCRDWVKSVTGIDPKTFAYPNGRPGVDFDERHSKMVEEAGFSAAATTDWQLANGKTTPFSVPRVGPWWRQGRNLESGLVRSYLKTYL